MSETTDKQLEDADGPPEVLDSSAPEAIEKPADVASEMSSESTPDAALNAGSSLPILPFVVLGVGLLAVAAGLFFGWQKHNALDARLVDLEHSEAQVASDQTRLDEAIQNVQRQLSGIENRVASTVQENLTKEYTELESDLRDQTAQLKSASISQKARIDEAQIRMDAYQNRLTALSTTTREDWKLAEAEYLLRLANQRVLLENNPTNAIALLEAADAIVEEAAAGLGDPELFAIRRALAGELTELKLIPAVDRDGLYLSLQSLAERVDALPIERKSLLLTESVGDVQKQTIEEAADDGLGARAWQQIKSMAGALSQYVRIQKDDETLNPLLNQQAAQLTQLNVRILLQQAQVALLKEQPAAYQSSLRRAIEQVVSTFPESEQSIQYVSALENLVKENVKPTLPDLSGSLKALLDYIEQLHRQEKAES